MNILIVNQPVNNRGDEAAHRSLLRKLYSLDPEAAIKVLFINQNDDTVKQMSVVKKSIEYENIKSKRYKYGVFIYYTLKYRVLKLAVLHPLCSKIYKRIKLSDIVVCAPGGICMGLFQNWEHIYILSLARLLRKKIIYYSRSIGPFPEDNYSMALFKKISYSLLNSFEFVSLRDSKSIQLADKMNIKCIPSIDTAFLDVPQLNSLPVEILDILKDVEYCVFVPNMLTWHKAYNGASQELIDKFYCTIIERILSNSSQLKIVMLPQIFNDAVINDKPYFEKLKARTTFLDKIIIIDDIYSSDIQQLIISKSKFVIGARYHSVVFAINNNRPFIALSYEHKIDGLLDLLDLESRKFDISNLGKKESNDLATYKLYDLIDSLVSTMEGLDPQYSCKARNMALACFNEAVKTICNLCSKG